MTSSGVWILAEQDNGRILCVSHELLTRGIELAQKRGCELSALVLGDKINEEEIVELIERGADKVVVMEAPQLATFLVEPYAECAISLIKKLKPEIMLAGATSTGRTLMPYIAMKLHTGLTADCTGLDIENESGNLLQTRPAIGGNIMATIKTPNSRPQMATVRPKSTPPAPRQKGRKGEIIRLKETKPLVSRVQRKDFIHNEDAKGIQDAERVVVVGRGIKRPENIAIVRMLAEKIDAALGATRDVVDRGWLSYPHQVGLSGKTITPKLYIGVGVSGSIQHLAGMQTSECIVAVNNDPEAQIFKVADIGLVGDLFEIVPALIAQIEADGSLKL